MRAGARAFINGTDASRVNSAVADMRKAGLQAEAICFDVSDEAAVVKAFETLDAQGIAIDILVDNAGIQFRKPMVELSTADWQRVIDVNLTSAFVVGREAARRMLPRKQGKIINIGSLTSALARATIAPYTAAKGGIKLRIRLIGAQPLGQRPAERGDDAAVLRQNRIGRVAAVTP